MSEDDELRALLHDDPVTQISQSALTAETDAGTGTGTGGTTVGTAGNSGAAGTGGSVGPVSDGGVMTGVAGGGGATGGAGTGGRVDGGGSTGIAGNTGIAGTTGIGGSNPTGMAGFMGRGGFPGPGGAGGAFGALGRWQFDDCNPSRANLFDQSGQGNTAFRSVSVQCTDGIAGQAVALTNKDEDIVYVPDQPNFTFARGVTVAAWFNHTATSQTRTLFRKREEGSNSSFALVMNSGKYQFVVDLGSRAVSVTAPSKATLGQWTHVGATYDGFTLRLYVGGLEVANKVAAGFIAGGGGPLLMGNDGSKRLMAGRIDQAVFDARAFSAAEMGELTCLRRPPTIAATPLVSAPTPTGATASFDIALSNNDTPSCGAGGFSFQANTFAQGITVAPSSTFLSVPAGTTSHVTMNATANDDVDSGTFPIQFFAFPNNGTSPGVSGSVDFVVVASGCRVSTPRELMITNLGVVDNIRTFGDGPWSFKHLMEAMAPTPEDAPTMVEDMLRSFTATQTVNSFDIGPRPNMQFELDAWPRTPDGKLDLSRPLVQLEAIVNRFDLRNLAAGDAGEGRFVFGFQFPIEGMRFALQATIILEYKLPATTPEDVQAWADAWHGLGALELGSEAYNAALEVITERFAGRGMRPGQPNGSAINAVRTNEIDFGDNGIWQLREFGLSPSTGMLVPTTIKLTPDQSFNFTDRLASFVNANEAAIIAETHTVPETFEGEPFLSGSVLNNFSNIWFAAGITNSEARHHFAVNTCNGCHSIETGVGFLQIFPRSQFGGEAALSGFLTGTTVSDPVTGQTRTFNDLARRRADLRQQVCAEAPPMMGSGGGGSSGGSRPAPSPTSSTTRLGTLTKGLSRVH